MTLRAKLERASLGHAAHDATSIRFNDNHPPLAFCLPVAANQ
jgi:hypothetical protein